MTKQDISQDIELVKALADECQAASVALELQALSNPDELECTQAAVERRKLAAAFRLLALIAEEKLRHE